MKYKLFDNKTGVILSRCPELIELDFEVSFVEAPIGATAIFENCSGDSIYREIINESCVVPADILKGTIKVTIVLFDDTSKPQKWLCEELVAKTLKDGSTLVMPNDMNMPQKFVELMLKNQELKDYVTELEVRLKTLEDKFEDVFEGHNYI